MYRFLKAIALRSIPKRFLYQNEVFFRYFHGIFYWGTTYQCNICRHTFRKFLTVHNSAQQCPFCGSLARTRRLYYLLTTEIGLEGTILHFSPARPLYRALKSYPGTSYYSTDYESEFLATHQYDITNLPVANHFFDRIICYHILEHITNDIKAMQELYRVLKPGGVALIQTPFKEGEISEDPNIILPEERLAHFGQEDHVRIYSVTGLLNRLKSVGFKQVEVRVFEKQNELSQLYAFEKFETTFIIHK